MLDAKLVESNRRAMELDRRLDGKFAHMSAYLSQSSADSESQLATLRRDLRWGLRGLAALITAGFLALWFWR